MVNGRLQNQQSIESELRHQNLEHFSFFCDFDSCQVYSGKRQRDYLFPLTIAFWPSDEHLLIQEKTDRPLTSYGKDSPFLTGTAPLRTKYQTRPKGKIAILAILEANSVCFS